MVILTWEKESSVTERVVTLVCRYVVVELYSRDGDILKYVSIILVAGTDICSCWTYMFLYLLGRCELLVKS